MININTGRGLTREDDRVLGGAAAGEDGAGLALVRPGHGQRGGAVRGQRQAGQDEQHSPGVAGGHSPPALRPGLNSASGQQHSMTRLV